MHAISVIIHTFTVNKIKIEIMFNLPVCQTVSAPSLNFF